MKMSRLLVGCDGVDISMLVLRMSIGTVKSVKIDSVVTLRTVLSLTHSRWWGGDTPQEPCKARLRL